MIAVALFLVASASGTLAGAQEPRPGYAGIADADRLAGIGNVEEARVRVEIAIAELLAAHPEAVDAEDDRALRSAGALAYRLRSMEPARLAWDAVRRYREKTLEANSLELQNARGNVSWIGEQMGLVSQARALEEQILAALETSLPPEHDALQMARANLADTLLQQGEPARALALFQKVVEVRRAKFPAGHPQRLRAELDLASGLVGTDDLAGASRLLASVLQEAPGDASTIRMRAAAGLVWIDGATTPPEISPRAVRTLATELKAARAEIARFAWREAEARAGEIAPFFDLLLSAAQGLGCTAAVDESVALSLEGLAPVGRSRPSAVYHRFERTRIEGRGPDRRVVADERLGAAVFPDERTARWIDLGPLAAARALVQAWDSAARSGDARPEAALVSETLFAPVAKALGDPELLRIVPDDVIWAVPLHALDLRTKAGRPVTVEAVLPAPAASDPAPAGAWSVLGDPAPTSESASQSALATGPIEGGAASAFVSSLRPSTSESTLAWARRLGVEPVRGDAASVARFGALSSSAAGVVLAAPIWSAPDDVPCLSAPRPIVSSTPLAAAMAREDVFGGSPSADLCGFLFADFAGVPGENERLPAAPRAADLRESHASIARRLVVAAPPPRADVVLRARDIAALARALVASGFADLCFATQTIRDVERVTLPAELKAAIPRATSAPENSVPGPWIRVRAIR
ncbi:MAG: tetratricopeptide repeat protein [Planctomycetota bacterium]|nr:tetratricopeptide repeat protein [Planctomycetota bacterium]